MNRPAKISPKLCDHEFSKSCLVCGSELESTVSGLFDTRFGIPESYSAALCTSCGLEQITPCPEQGQLKHLYECFYNFGGEQNTKYAAIRQRFLLSSLYRIWMMIDGDISFHACKGKGLLLDVGCNEGRGLVLYRRNGWQVEGLELNPVAAETAKSKGFVVHEALIENFSPDKRYDVVVLSNVLEHSLRPDEMLRHVHRVLRPCGQLWISCPNGKSLQRAIFGRYWINWHVPFHVVHFSPGTIKRLLEDTLFGSVTIRQETPALWFAHSLIAAFFARSGSPTKQLRNPVMVSILIVAIRMFLFPVFWCVNRSGRGDCMVIKAERI